MGMNEEGEGGSLEERLEHPSGQRASGVYPSVTLRFRPRRPVRVGFHLRLGLGPPESETVTTLALDDASRMDGVHAVVLDAVADPWVLDRVLRRAVADRESDPEGIHRPIFVCGVLPCAVLLRLATAAHAVAASDPTVHDGLHFVLQEAERAGRRFARLDHHSRHEWARTEIAPWITGTACPEAGLTKHESVVLALYVLGFGRLEVATLLGLAEATVKTHIQKLLKKTGHDEMPTAVAPLRARLGPVAPDDAAASSLDRAMPPARLLLDTRTPPGGRRI